VTRSRAGDTGAEDLEAATAELSLRAKAAGSAAGSLMMLEAQLRAKTQEAQQSKRTLQTAEREMTNKEAELGSAQGRIVSLQVGRLVPMCAAELLRRSHAVALEGGLRVEILSEGSSLSPGKRLHHQRSSRHAMVPLSDTSPHPEG
jgi:hypothetical protein